MQGVWFRVLGVRKSIETCPCDSNPSLLESIDLIVFWQQHSPHNCSTITGRCIRPNHEYIPNLIRDDLNFQSHEKFPFPKTIVSAD